MKIEIKTIIAFALSLTLYSFNDLNVDTHSLTIRVKNLRNDKGEVQIALYNKNGSIPDENYKNYYKILKGKIVNASSTITFNNIPSGKYAVNILHDENKNGKIDKGFILPIEGFGFSNFQSISFKNKPTFSKASFTVNEDKSMSVKVIYM
ncbi:hypothetical protein MATR_34830 [Marivirga tractuosa]|uniref:DUF2141 domain-containing protein n=1 Tax=Marivirga tractuosa (strain ATCC 23168 / DSM 4126 / NBRC 15989 / NCIMB 1408 / VKM B-1430 / H-43) TaxID=643867 RepID=E4TQE8_MARTH|nr:DUF2141 domain-containing protein [Marivirga tractuosa]ADR22671.1 Protein of unknown function DUF2141 [Marivirga tractuosa DSM 4126]BDD16658.1 hypothetical protein MATR_34830 [Marivirga tractuosa]